MEVIKENIERIKARVSDAALRSGRNPEDISLIAVTKTVSLDRIRSGIEAGLNVFGESRIQEAEKKISVLGRDSIEWHFIGHLQTNKVKKAIGLFDLIHSVDSLHLAIEIEKRASGTEVIVPVLLQVNIAYDELKPGFSAEGLFDVLYKISRFNHLSILGLMTIPPWSEYPEDSRRYYRELSRLREDVLARDIEGISMDYLSMGMSNDFEVAIEEGANMVRIGTAIFGTRSKL